jgi:hypothetical protein
MNEIYKSESCFSRIKRIKRAHEELHKACFDKASFATDEGLNELFKVQQINDSSIPPVNRPLALPHPSWKRDFEAK